MTQEPISQFFQLYLDRMTNVCLYHRAIKKNANKELEELHEYSLKLKEHPQLEEFSSSLHNMYFRSAQNGNPVFYGHKKNSVQDRVNEVFYHKNKQYQWLLAEAYELFSEAIKNAYAYAAYKDKNAWPLSDYGNITFAEMVKNDFGWFQQRAKNKDAKKLFAYFRDRYPEVRKIEISNSFKINLQFSLVMIEFLRHIIVHNGGVTTDKEKLFQNIFTESGFYNNGNYDKDKNDYLNSFFGIGDHEKLILLLEMPVNLGIPIDSYIDRLDGLFSHLMSYAHLVCSSLQSQFSAENQA